MGRKNKFDKLGVNPEFQGEPSQQEKDTSKKENAWSEFLKTAKQELFPGVWSNFDGDKDGKSSKFKFKKNVKTGKSEVYTKKASVPRGIISSHVLMLCVMCIVVALAFAQINFKAQGYYKYALILGVSTLVYIIPSVIYCVIKKLTPGRVYLKLFSPSMLAMSAVSLLLMMSLTALEKYYIAYNFAYRITESVPYGTSAFETILVSAVIPAVFETFFVNGVLMSEYSRFGGGVTGIIASGIVFGFLHLDSKMFVIYFTAGLVLGVLTHISGSVYPAMLVHFANNATAIFLADRMTFIASERIGGTFLMTVLGIFCFVFLLILLQMAEKQTYAKYAKAVSDNKADKNTEYPQKDRDREIHFLCPEGATGKRFLRLVFSPAMLAVLAVFIIVNL